MQAKEPELTIPQSRFLSLPHKFRAFVAGFGSGKTWCGCTGLCIHACEYPKINSGYFAPTYSQIRDIFYPTIEEVAFNIGLKVDIKEANKEVHYYSGRSYRSTTICRSMEKPGTIVGFKIGHAMIDEIDTMPTLKAELAWRKVIARMRYKVDGLKNGVDITTTPEGFKFTYKKFVSEKSESYGMIQASTYDNEQNLPDDYIPSLVETYPQALIDAYLNGQFVNMVSGSVYKSFNRSIHDSQEVENYNEVLYIGQDFNVCNMTSAICVKRGDSYHAVYELTGIYDTPALIKTLKEKFPKNNIYIYPDASGNNRHSSNASESDIFLLRNAGFNIRVNTRNPFVKDRVLSVNKAFESGKLYINTRRCKKVSEAVEKQAYDDNGEPDKKSGYDHPCDALGYVVAYEMPVIKPALVSNIRMGM